MNLLHMSLPQMSFSGAVLILVVALIRAAAVNRMPKKTFLVLWWIVLLRLLLPFSVPSPWSVYSIMQRNIPAETVDEMRMGNFILTEREGQPEDVVGTEIPEGHAGESEVSSPCVGKEAISGFSAGKTDILWFAGMVCCAVFFATSYIRRLLEFRTSLPVQNAFVERWLKENPLMRPLSVRQSDRISAPLTYGVLKSVILMPKTTDWENKK